MKKLLFAALAVCAISGIEARQWARNYIRIDNDLDGKQETDIRAVVTFSDGTQKVITVKGDRERNVYFKPGAYPINVMVIGLPGAQGKMRLATGKIARYRIPVTHLKKTLKVDVDYEKGNLVLSRD